MFRACAGSRSRAIVLSSLVLLVLLVGPRGLQAAGSFTDITSSSGLSAIQDSMYATDTSLWMSGLSLIDLNSDNRLDLFIGAHTTTGVAIMNDGTGHFSLATGTAPTNELHLAYDINNDHKIDVTMNTGDGGGQWWKNSSTTSSLNFTKTGSSLGAGRTNAMIDYNRDGKVDWLVGAGVGVQFYNGNGSGTFTLAKSLSVANSSPSYENSMIPFDYDGDGYIDLAVSYGRYGTYQGSRLYHNDGTGNFVDVTTTAGLTVDNYWVKGTGDYNRDGKMDLIILNPSKQPEIWLNNGNGMFTKKANSITGSLGTPSYGSWGMAVTTDFDNDGKPDIICNVRNLLWILKGNGDGTFTYMNSTWGIDNYSAAAVDDGECFGDVNGDGKLDIVGYTTTGSPQRFKLYRNDLTGTGHYLNVRLVGTDGNIGATGSKITVTDPATGAILWYDQVMDYNQQSDQSYYSFDTTERHVGLGNFTNVNVRVEFYPSGKIIDYYNVSADQTFTANEVPEPATLSLLALGVLAMLRGGRRN